MYVTMFSCNECAKLIIQARVAGIVFLSDKHHDKDSWVASRRMLDLAGTVAHRCRVLCVAHVVNCVRGSAPTLQSLYRRVVPRLSRPAHADDA